MYRATSARTKVAARVPWKTLGMHRGTTTIVLLLLSSTGYWRGVCWITGAREPWDAADYWRLWYPCSFVLSALFGWVLKRRGWMAGAILTFAQLPVVGINAGIGALLPAGLAVLCALAGPVIAVSALSGWIAERFKPV